MLIKTTKKKKEKRKHFIMKDILNTPIPSIVIDITSIY